MLLEHRDILSVKGLLPAQASTVAEPGRLLASCSSLKNVKDPRTWPLPAFRPSALLWRSGRVHGGAGRRGRNGDPG